MPVSAYAFCVVRFTGGKKEKTENASGIRFELSERIISPFNANNFTALTNVHTSRQVAENIYYVSVT
jgi:hypothetical protein